MKLLYNGSDIWDKVSVNTVIHNTYCEGQSDSVTIIFNDQNSIWQDYNAKIGDSIQFLDGKNDTGIMYVRAIKPVNGQYEITALATPVAMYIAKDKSWENITFDTLCNEIAAKYNLTYCNYGCSPITYEYLKQVQISNF